MIIFKNSNAKNRITASVMVMVMLILAMIVFIIYPSAKRIKQLSQDISVQKQELDDIYARGQNLSKTIKQYENVKPRIAELTGIYLQEGEELKLITALEQAASKAGVTLDKQLSSNKDSQNNSKILPLQLTVGGNFAELIQFMVELEKMDYYLNVSNIRINKSSNSSSLNTLLLTNAYYQP